MLWMKRADKHQIFPIAVGVLATAACVLLWLYGAIYFGFGDVEQAWRCNAVMPGDGSRVLSLESRCLESASESNTKLERPAGDATFARPVFWETGRVQEHVFTCDATGAWCDVVGQQVRAADLYLAETTQDRADVPRATLISGANNVRVLRIDNPMNAPLKLIRIGAVVVAVEVPANGSANVTLDRDLRTVCCDSERPAYRSVALTLEPRTMPGEGRHRPGFGWTPRASDVTHRDTDEIADALRRDLLERYRDVPFVVLLADVPAETEGWSASADTAFEFWAAPINDKR
jgi:hypothetical protein